MACMPSHDVISRACSRVGTLCAAADMVCDGLDVPHRVDCGKHDPERHKRERERERGRERERRGVVHCCLGACMCVATAVVYEETSAHEAAVETAHM